MATLARPDQRRRGSAWAACRQGRLDRPDERVLSGRAQRLHRGDAFAVGPGVQDPARSVRLLAAATRLRRSPADLPAAPPWREQARCDGGLGIPDAGAAEAGRPRGPGALSAV